MSQNRKENLEDVGLLCKYGGKEAMRKKNSALHNIICKSSSEKDYRKDDFI